MGKYLELIEDYSTLFQTAKSLPELLNSYDTTSSSPTTHALCPGAHENASPAETVISDPSS